ncbi:MAG: DUF2341 domain-containing protein, partial [Candidatus Margulisbacteria bacterium]|nr:DUF2341 domain-containing protein [Candidatus Margulisiibacteriota bacterium]
MALSSPAHAADLIIDSPTTWTNTHEVYDTVTIRNGATLTFSGIVTLECTNLTIEVGSSISANYTGYTAQLGPGGSTSGNGASYGGFGGIDYSGSTADTGPIYGDPFNPYQKGSGGGGTGGAGGGAIIIIASGIVTNEGSITARGEVGGWLGGGGSGGSININCDHYAGSGTIIVQGGQGGNGNPSAGGGGGGGGRALIQYNTTALSQSEMDAASNALGGPLRNGSTAGDNGSFAWLDKNDNDLYVFDGFDFQTATASYNNCYFKNAANVRASVESFSLTATNNINFDNVIWLPNINTTMTLSANSFLFSSLTMQNGGFISIESGSDLTFTDSTFTTVASSLGSFTCADNISFNFVNSTINGIVIINNAVNVDIDSNSSLNADGRGYAGQQGPGGSSSGNGGSHGGEGGIDYGGSTADTGPTYDDPFYPDQIGSGGGGSTGSAGGGLIKIFASGTVTHEGSIFARGLTGGWLGGGGAGGTVHINCEHYVGNGTVSVQGGLGGNGNPAAGGGGGGGGRALIQFNTTSVTVEGMNAASNALGGAKRNSSQPGDNGSFVWLDKNDNDIYVFDGLDFQTASESYNNAYFKGVANLRAAFASFSLSAAGYINFDNTTWVPDINTTLTLSANSYLFTDTTLANGGSISIESASDLLFSGSTITTGTSTQDSFSCSSNISFAFTDSTVNANTILDNAVNIMIDSNSTINADAMGYLKSAGPGGSTDGNGGSHGGVGGPRGSGSSSNTGPTYENPFNPCLPGSGGGNANGGTGGGYIILSASGTVSHEGTITADGSNGGNYGGGGSGGTVNINCNDYKGAGTITVKGGNGGWAASSGPGGGGGGRMLLQFNTTSLSQDNMDSATDARSGSGQVGGANGYYGSGVWYDKDTNELFVFDGIDFQTTSENYNNCYFKNAAYLMATQESFTLTSTNNMNFETANWYPSNNTLLHFIADTFVFTGNIFAIGGSVSFETSNDLTFTNSSISVGTPTTEAFTLNNNVNVTFNNCDIYANTIIDNAINIIVDASTNFYCSEKGFSAQQGPGGSVASGLSGAGASHGGLGGLGYPVNGTRGPTYESYSNPVMHGSGGGRTAGGTGGGLVLLTASDTIYHYGAIYTNAGNATAGWTYAGGGSGGSIKLDAPRIIGCGITQANGGNGSAGSSSSGGGGGGGGRIAFLATDYIEYCTVTNATVTRGTRGNSGAEYGEVGTIFGYYAQINSVSAMQLPGVEGKNILTFEADHPGDKNDLIAIVEYSTDAGTTWNRATTLSTLDADTWATQGDPWVINTNTYQVGTAEHYIETSAGANTVTSTNWDISSITGIETTEAKIRVTAMSYSLEVISGTIESSGFIWDTTAPTGLADFQVNTQDTNSISLTWTAANDPFSSEAYSQYIIWYGTIEADVENQTGSADDWTKTNDANLAGLASTSTTVTGLLANTQYFMKIFAYDDYFNSMTLNDINGTTESPGPDYYVDANATSGNITGDGSYGNPWQTITYALSQSSAGNTIHVATGEYSATMPGSVETFPITLSTTRKIVGPDTGTANVNGAGTSQHVFNVSSSNCTIEGLTISKTVSDYNYVPVYINSSNCKIINNIINRSGNSRSIQSTSSGTNALITGNTINAAGASQCLYIDGANSTFSYNTVYPGSNATSSGFYFLSNSDGFTVQSNTIEGSPAYNLIYATSSNGHITQNKIIGGGIGAWPAIGIEITNSTVTISSNEIRSMTDGILLANNCPSISIYNNTITKYSSDGIRINTTGGTASITKNIISAAPSLTSFTDGSVGIYHQAGSVSEGYNNIYNNDTSSYDLILDSTDQLTQYPRFVDPDNNNYYLYSDSPCVNPAAGIAYMGAYPPVAYSSGITTEGYVSGSGNDTTGDGSLGNPWRSITYAVATTEGTIYVMDGLYNTANGETFPINTGVYTQVLQYNTSTATVDAANNDAANQHVFVLGDSCTIEGLIIRSTTTTNDNYCIYSEGDNCSVFNNTINRSGQQCSIKFENNSTNALITGNIVNASGAGNYCIDVNGASAIIRNNEINTGSGNSSGIIFGNLADGSTLQSNTIIGSHNYDLITVGTYADNVTLNNNLIVGAGSYTDFGIRFSYCVNGTVTSNEVRNVDTGINLAAGNSGTFNIKENTIVKFTSNGIYITTATANIRNNIISASPYLNDFTNGSRGIYRTGGTVNENYNNIYNNDTNYDGTFSQGANDQIAQYPRFVNPTNNNFYLYSDSPCKNAADDGTFMGRYPAIGESSGITTEGYVSGTGNDTTGNGSIDNPWRSITHAVSTTEGIIYVMDGLYNDGNGESFPIKTGSYTQILQYATSTATLDAETNAQHVLQLGDTCTIEGITINFSTTTNAMYCLYVEGDDCDILNNIINRSGKQCSINIESNSTNAFINGNTIYSSNDGNECIEIDGTNAIITNNYIRTGSGNSYGIVFNGNADGFTLENNTIEGTTNYVVVDIWYNSGFTIKSNIIQGAGTGTDAGIRFSQSSNGTITSNEVRSTTDGIYSANGNTGTTTLNQNTIIKNTNGVHVNSGTANVKNTIIANDPDDAGGTGGAAGSRGLYQTAGTLNSQYNDIYGCETLYVGTVGDKTGDISLNSAFVDTSGNDYRLYEDSPCAGTGTPTGTNMGAYGTIEGLSFQVTIITPNGGESWEATVTNYITFEVNGSPTSANFYYSVDGGNTYTLIATNESATSPYAWLVPNDPTTEARIKMEILGSIATDESNGDFTIYYITPPSVYSISPNTGNNDEILNDVVITGETFADGAAVKLTKTGESDIDGTDVTFISDTQLTADFDLNGAALGYWSVVVTNPNTKTDTLTDGFEITYPPPTVTVVTPESGPTLGGTAVTISGSNFLPSGYQRTITVTNDGTAQTDFQVLVELNTAAIIGEGKMRSDGGDIRFYASDESTSLPYWIEVGTNTPNTRIWVKIPEILNGENTIYMRYGNLSDASQSSGTDTFIFFDDFEDGNIDGWVQYESGSVGIIADPAPPPGVTSNYSLQKYNAGDPNGGWRSLGTTIGLDHVFDARIYRFSGTNYDRLSIEKTTVYDGYGFFVNHANTIAIEERDNANPTTIGSTVAYDPPELSWYKSEFIMKSGGSFYLNLYDMDHNPLSNVPERTDSSFSSFDLVAVRGGTVYYVDDIRVRKYANPTITTYVGTNETGGTLQVRFGGTAATGIQYINSNTVTATTPAHIAGTIEVDVRNTDGQIGTLEAAFEFTEDLVGPTVTVEAPNGGEIYKGGNHIDVTWFATDESGIDYIRISYTTGGGWLTLATNEANDGVYDWKLPYITTTEALVKVEAVDDSPWHNIATDESNAYFTIDSTPPQVNLGQPIGGEILTGNTFYPITWEASDNISLEATPIRIQYSINNKATWNNIVTNEANDGSYLWLVPNNPTNEAFVKVLVQDAAGWIASDEGTASFTIEAAYAGPHYYVNAATTEGNLVGDGSINNPWQTLTWAESLTGIKAIIHIATGEYTTSMTGSSESFPINLGPDKTYIGAGTAWTTFEGGSSNIFNTADFTTIDSLYLNSSSGAPMCITVFGSQITIQNCAIENSAAAPGGTGIYVDASGSATTAVQISSCEVFSLYNGIHLSSGASAGPVTIESCNIHDNEYRNIYVDGWNNTVFITKNVLRDCPQNPFAGNYYGSIVMEDINTGSRYVTIDRNTIVKNKFGMVENNSTSANITVTNNIISNAPDGSAPEAGSVGIAGYVTNSYNDVYDNQTNYGVVSQGPGGITQLAKFRDVANDDYHLNYNSPCINTGDPTAESDPDGSRADMGAIPFDLTIPATIAVCVVQPNVKGTNLTGATTYEVMWRATSEASTPITSVGILYSIDSGANYNYITTEANTGSYIWMVPNVTTSAAYVKVGAFTAVSAATDESDNNFNITAQDFTGPVVTVEAPNGGEEIQGGATYNITWLATDPSGIDRILIYYATGEGWINLATNEANDGLYVWAVPSLDTAEALVKIEAVDSTASHNVGTDESDGYFIIDSTGPSEPILLTPPSGSTTSDATPTFTWEASTDNLTGIGSYEITISGITTETIGNITNWTISTPLSEGLHTWVVRARDRVGNWGDYSMAGSFTVSYETYVPSVEVITPNGGEIWKGGSSYDITWTATDESGIDEIRIYYSTGEGWVTIATQESNDGSYSWTIPTLSTTEALVKVEAIDASLNHNIGSDESNAYFTIDSISPEVTIGQPNGGEILTGYSYYNITWEASDNISLEANPISIYYSTDGKTSWNEIISGTANDGTHSWYVPNNPTSETWLRISAIDAAGWITSVESAASFTLEAAYSGPDFYVDASTTEGNVIGDGSIGNPWQTITYALTRTSSGAIIHIAAGTYSDTMTGSNETIPIPLSANRSYIGVGSNLATIESLSDTVLAPFENVTIEGVCVNDAGGNIAISVRYYNFNLRNSKIIGNNGYGIHFNGNTGGNQSGGRVTSCEVYNHYTGIYLYDFDTTSAVTIEGCDIHDSTENINIYAFDSPVTILKNVIRDGSSYGVRLRYIDSGNKYVTIDRNTIVRNNSYGIRGTDLAAGRVTVINNIVSYKPDGSDPGGSSYGIRTSIDIDNAYNNVYGNTYDFSDGADPGPGRISQLAQFINISNNDYHLSYNSPCIDSGDPSTETDPDASRADMGAFYFDLTVPGTIAVYVKAPNDGENLYGGDPYEVTWYATSDATSPVVDVDLYYSIDGGSSFTHITTEANDGSYIWTVANVSTTEAKIRVGAFTATDGATDESDYNFNISASIEVNLFTPDGGESWAATTTQNITWETTGPVTGINLYYSIDGGNSYTPIATNESDTGSYAWLVPNQLTTEAKVKIEALGSIATDESSGTFTITSSSYTGPHYYVDAATTEGNVVGNGSINNPWQTITWATSQTTNGAIVHIAAGEYSSSMTGSSESFPINLGGNRSWLGAGSSNTTIEAGNNSALKLYANTTLESLYIHYRGNNKGIETFGENTYITSCVASGEVTGSNTGIYFNGETGNNTGGRITSCEVTRASYGFQIVGNVSTKPVTIESCNLYGNEVQIYVYAWGSPITIRKNVVYSASGIGVGTYFYEMNQADREVLIDRNTIAKNQTGIRLNNCTSSYITIINNIICFDPDNLSTGTESYGLLSSPPGSSASSGYNNVYGNADNYFNVATGESSKTQIAQFRNAANDDYHLNYNSPCIDAGSPETEADPDGSRADMGALYFDETVPGTIAVYVSTPNGGETLTGFSAYEVTWYATKEGTPLNRVEIAYSIDNGTSFINIVTNEANDGSYSWAVPNTPTTEAKIRIGVFGSAATDESDGTFTILSGDTTTPLVTVEAPNGNEYWKGGISYNITWTATDESGIDEIRIYYSTGEGWVTIATNEANDGTYPWTTPLLNTTEALVKVLAIDSAPSHNVGSDESNSYFTIDSTVPTVEVGQPNGGEILTGKSFYNITWEASDNISLEANPISIYYSTDGKTSWNEIISGTANDGTHSWYVPNNPTSETWLRISATDAAGWISSAESAASFTIEAAYAGPHFYVDATTTEGNIWGDGSLSNPWQTISWATLETSDGAIIHIQPGTYSDSMTGSSESFPIDLGSNRSWLGTVLGTSLIEAGNSGGFICHDDTTIESLSINFAGNSNIGIEGSGQSINISDCTISGEAVNGNIGIYFVKVFATPAQYQTGGTISSCEVHSAYYGISLNCGGGGYTTTAVNIENNLVYNNSYAQINTAGWTSPVTIRRNLAYSNKTDSYGIIVFNSNAAVDINQNTVSKTKYGIEANGTSSNFVTVKDNIVCNAPDDISPTAGSYGIRVATGNSITNRYNNIYGNETEYVEDAAAGTGSISRLAQFTNISNNDYHLNNNSPCIDSGDPTSEADPDGSRADMGAFYFDLTIPNTVAAYVIEPNGGENLTGNTTYETTWYATSESGTPIAAIDIYYSIDGGSSFTHITNEANDGSYIWTVVNTSTDEAKLRVRASTAVSYATDDSDNNFDISASVEVNLITPNGGETWEALSYQNITWETTGPVTGINLYYSIDGGTSYSQFATNESDTGSYSWLVPNEVTTEAKVKIEALGSIATDESTGTFTITSSVVTTPTVTVEAPNGNEFWKGGVSYDITWFATDEAGIDEIKIYYTTGEGWITIATGEDNDGTYPWTTPLLNTTEALVRIEAVDSSPIHTVGTDESDTYFTIDSVSPEVNIGQPNGGEILNGKTFYNITWEASDNISLEANPISIYYSTDGKSSWNEIISGTANDGTHSWYVPNNPTSETWLRISAIDAAGWITSAESAASFTIEAAYAGPHFYVDASTTEGNVVGDGSINNPW